MTNQIIELKEILIQYCEKYPLWDITDAVKLIYQNEFGGRHLVRDRDRCIQAIINETAEAENSVTYHDFEDIGNGTLRANLIPLIRSGTSAEKIADAFIRSTKDTKGTVSSFKEKLSLLIKMTEDGLLPFSPKLLKDFILDYEAAGFPTVSHSDKYKKEYFPAYRLISNKYLPF